MDSAELTSEIEDLSMQVDEAVSKVTLAQSQRNIVEANDFNMAQIGTVMMSLWQRICLEPLIKAVL